jgi:hypothetical protein
MFNLEIENKIVDFIKTSPLGVTSNEIAKNFGLNRMTITKYLAIIREKALIDFKQFGMAKLWYIPVNLNKEGFLDSIATQFAKSLPKEQFKDLSEKAGITLGQDINQMYLQFYDLDKLTVDQVCDAYTDIGKKLGGSFKVKAHADKISVEIAQSPFEEKAMNRILSAVFAKIASLNLGYAKVFVNEGENVVVDIFLKKELSS